MGQPAETTTDSIVWEDEFWTLLVEEPDSESSVALSLQPRDPEGLGQLDDEQASQLGRIANRLVRIIEHLPGTGRVQLGRGEPGTFGMWFRAAADDHVTQLDDEHLHTIAAKLANWGGEARA